MESRYVMSPLLGKELAEKFNCYYDEEQSRIVQPHTGSDLYDSYVRKELISGGAIPEEQLPDLSPGSAYAKLIHGNP